MPLIKPNTEHLSKWIKESLRQAQGKKQKKLANKFNTEFELMLLYIDEVTEEYERLTKELNKLS
jgi:hypothetical protein